MYGNIVSYFILLNVNREIEFKKKKFLLGCE